MVHSRVIGFVITTMDTSGCTTHKQCELRLRYTILSDPRYGVINGRRLGKWLAAQAGRIVGGLSIEQGGFEHASAMSWRVVDRAKKPGAAQARQPQSEDVSHDIPF